MKRKKIRFLYMILTGILISVIMNFMVPDTTNGGLGVWDILVSVLITVIVWEGNLRIDSWMNQRFPWVDQPLKRILIQALISVSYSAVFIFGISMLFNVLFYDVPEGDTTFYTTAFVILGILVLFSLLVLSIEISLQFFRKWKNSLVEVEHYRSEKLQAQLQNLISQVNPHFLFNNLSVLSSLVYKDQDKAVDFINQLSKVYRYLLDHRDSDLVTVEQEIEFIHAYIYLLKIRFEDKIRFRMDIPPERMGNLIPQMVLQMLIENAMKHNESSVEEPLEIGVSVVNGMLAVTNNLQLRPDPEPDSGTGLKNIRERYRFFTEIPVDVSDGPSIFQVKIPLLQAK